MALIKSISGIRGTIGGKAGEGLSPLDVVKFVAAYGSWIKKRAQSNRLKVVVGRDARISGEMIYKLVESTLVGIGIDVINIGLATTPTTEMAVIEEKADGGLILTASHNPKDWNALKMLNEKGEFLNAKEGEEILTIADSEQFKFVDVDGLGKVEVNNDHLDNHIQKIKDLNFVDIDKIKNAKFRVVIDAVNSVGGIAIPKLLRELGVEEVIELYCEPTGDFPHNPEPLPEHLTKISEVVKENNAHIGFVVDPDVDRLAIVNEDGSTFGEEYTLVAVADYILKNVKGNTVSNLSSTRALKDITIKHGAEYYASAVGEVNVVEAMKKYNAVIGGEGNGGIILPRLHYGRDALVGIALFLTFLAEENVSCSDLRNRYPTYHMAKNKMQLTDDIDVDALLNHVKEKYKESDVDSTDGVKINFEKGWVHLRKSNTEPIIRIYTEEKSAGSANELAQKMINEINEIIKR